jgi:antitoxin component of MazEF toxin-antitoxin module
MTATLTAIGDGFGVVIDKEILEQLGISPATELEIFPEDGCIVIGPKGARLRRVQAASARSRPPSQPEPVVRLPKKQPW